MKKKMTNFHFHAKFKSVALRLSKSTIIPLSSQLDFIRDSASAHLVQTKTQSLEW